MAIFTEQRYMNGKHFSQLKKPMDSQKEYYNRLMRDIGFATQGQQTLSLRNSNDSAPPAGKNNQMELGIFLAQENLAGERAGDSPCSYPPTVRNRRKRSQVSCCALLATPDPLVSL